MPNEDHICIVGKFKELSYDHGKFVHELRAIVDKDAFPWTCKEVLFRPPTTELLYVLDENMHQIAKRYEDCGNENGFLSLISVTYNLDAFGADDGLYGKIVVRTPRGREAPAQTALIQKVFFTIHNHIPLEEGEKQTVNLPIENLPSDPNIPPSIQSLWMKVIVERRGHITQHILFGKKGEAKKVHVFCRPSEPQTYEDTPAHHTPLIAPFRQIAGVVVKNGKTHTYHVKPAQTRPAKEKTKH